MHMSSQHIDVLAFILFPVGKIVNFIVDEYI
jgi:hypothetical protein